MFFESKEGVARAMTTPKTIEVYHRGNANKPGVTLIVRDRSGDEVLLYLTYEQSTELSGKLATLPAMGQSV